MKIYEVTKKYGDWEKGQKVALNDAAAAEIIKQDSKVLKPVKPAAPAQEGK